MADFLKEALDELGLGPGEQKDLIEAISDEADRSAEGKTESYTMDEVFE